MADISITTLDKFFGEKQILSDITLEIFPGEKVAIVGPNGAGKTTLFKILTGELSYDKGSVSIAKDRTLGIIDQIPVFPEGTMVEDVLRSAFYKTDAVRAEMTALEQRMASDDDPVLLKKYGALSAQLEAMGGYNLDYEVDKVANGLEITAEQRKQPFSVLSGGEKTRVNLARIILENTDILLLDEPTNHLDMDAVDWLGKYLDAYKGTVVTISHDRYFLDQCCERIIELNGGKCDFYAGSYSYYAEERKLRFERRLAEHENQLEELKRLEEQSRKMHQWGTEKMHKRAFSIDKRIAKMTVADRPKAEKKLSMTFGDPDYETEEVLKIKGVNKAFGDKKVLSNVTFNVLNGEKVAILGDNGAGKTTLLNIILGILPADEGTVRKGVGLRPAYLPQVVYFEHSERNLIDTLIYDKNITPQTARNRLGAFQFSGEDQLKTVSKLSGGEKSRLRLCELMYDPLNMLILDEPTNHLDILAREWIEEAIEGFTGTLLFVSHDRYFVQRFADRVIALIGGDVLDFKGTYDEFLVYKEKFLAGKAAASAPKAVKEAKPKPHGGIKSLAKQVAAIEREISALETQLAEYDRQMEHCASDPEKLMALMEEKEKAENELLSKLESWESLSSELAEG